MVNEETKKQYLSITPSPELRDKICQLSSNESTPTKKRYPMSRIFGLSACAAALLVLVVLGSLRAAPSEVLLSANGTVIGTDAVIVSQGAAMARMTLPEESGEALSIPLSLQDSGNATILVSAGSLSPDDSMQGSEAHAKQDTQYFVWVFDALEQDDSPTLTVQIKHTQSVYILYWNAETGLWCMKQNDHPEGTPGTGY